MGPKNFTKAAARERRLSMVTCYDYTSARLLADSSIDAILIGDSAAMVMHGYPTTLPASMEMMCWHTSAVARGAPEKFLIADMPFLSFRKSLGEGVEAAGRLMQAGAHAVKLEGAKGNLELIRHLVESGIPVMGHLGLTPQSVNTLGGFKVQGRDDEQARSIFEDAGELERAGCFSLVLECVPSELARSITHERGLAVIGIGAGPHTDGQVLVLQDLLGLSGDFKPKFVRRFAEGQDFVQKAVENYCSSVRSGSFPNEDESYL